MKVMGFDSANGGVSCNLLCSKAWFPATGGRIFNAGQSSPDYKHIDVGKTIYFWTASAESSVYTMVMDGGSSYLYTSYKCNGFPIRCQKE